MPRTTPCPACGRPFVFVEGSADRRCVPCQRRTRGEDGILDAVPVAEEPLDVLPVCEEPLDVLRVEESRDVLRIEDSTDVLPVASFEHVPDDVPDIAVPGWLAANWDFTIRAPSINPRSLDFCVSHADRDIRFAYMTEHVGAWRTFFEFFGRNKARSISEVVVHDAASRRPLVTITRSAFKTLFGHVPAQIDIEDEHGRRLADLEAPLFPGHGRLEIRGWRNLQRFEVSGMWVGKPDYSFYDEDGREIGQVLAAGSPRMFFGTDAIWSWCKRAGHLVVSLRVRDNQTKLLLLATALGLEILCASVRANLHPPTGRLGGT